MLSSVCRSLEQEICRTNKLEKTSRERYLNLQLHHSRNMELIEQTVGKVQWKKLEEVLKNKASLFTITWLSLCAFAILCMSTNKLVIKT